MVLQRLLDLVFPPFCASCDRIGRYLCVRHLNDLTWIYDGPMDDWIYSSLEYRDTTQKIVKLVKYRHLYRYAVLMAQLIAIRFPEFPEKIDCLIPVPLHPKKRKWRGFNQAELLAKHLSRIWNIPVVTDALVRDTHSQAQAGQNKQERTNVKHSFRAVKPLNCSRVAIVDDVATTGATLNACRQAILEHNQVEVLALTFAREV